jgi:hypothetical protein
VQESDRKKGIKRVKRSGPYKCIQLMISIKRAKGNENKGCSLRPCARNLSLLKEVIGAR